MQSFPSLCLSWVVCQVALLGFSGTAQAECDSVAGRKAFNKCAACHSLEAGVHMAGPDLAGIVGRKAGSVEDFTYSIALGQAGFSWSEEQLHAYLKSPINFLPGTTMPFGGLKRAEERTNLICFLSQQ